MTLRRYTELRPSKGTTWPVMVRAHVYDHQQGCVGPLAGMPGDCAGAFELDHVRASRGIGMKSDSIATNAARLCGWHHQLKTRAGKTWRPRLLTVIRSLFRGCQPCEAEHVETYGPLDDSCGHVEPTHGCLGPCQRRRSA